MTIKMYELLRSYLLTYYAINLFFNIHYCSTAIRMWTSIAYQDIDLTMKLEKYILI